MILKKFRLGFNCKYFEDVRPFLAELFKRNFPVDRCFINWPSNGGLWLLTFTAYGISAFYEIEFTDKLKMIGFLEDLNTDGDATESESKEFYQWILKEIGTGNEKD